MKTDTDTLGTLDPATTPADLDVRHDARAQQLLARLIATDPAPGNVVEALQPRRPVVRRVVAAGIAVAAAAVVTVAVPGLVGGDDTAHAAWTPVPTAVSAEEAEAAERACTEGAWGWLPGRQGPDLDLLLVEARGSWTLAYLADPSGMTEQVCILRDGEPVGSHGQAPGPGAEPVVVDADGAYGSIGGVFSTQEESLRSSTGIVGHDVTGLVLHTEARGDVTATIADGHYAAWWPDAPVTEASENADTTPSFTGATLTLRDGTTRELGVDELTGMTREQLTSPDTGGGSRSE